MKQPEINPDGLDERRAGWLMWLSDAKRRQICQRIWIVEQWEEFLGFARSLGRQEGQSTPAYVEFIARLGIEGVSRGTLFNWRRSARSDGLWGLVDLRWLKSRPEPAWPFVCSLADMYLAKRCRPIFIEDCHRRTMEHAEEYNWPRLTLAESRAWLRQRVPKETPARATAATGSRPHPRKDDLCPDISR